MAQEAVKVVTKVVSSSSYSITQQLSKEVLEEGGKAATW